MEDNEAVRTTARLNFGQKTDAPVENVQVEAEQAEEAQQEAMTAEQDETTTETVEDAPEALPVEAEAQTETSDAPVDEPEAPVSDQALEEATVDEMDAGEPAEMELPADEVVNQDVEDEDLSKGVNEYDEETGDMGDDHGSQAEAAEETEEVPEPDTTETVEEPSTVSTEEPSPEPVADAVVIPPVEIPGDPAMPDTQAAEVAVPVKPDSEKTLEELQAEKAILDGEIKARQDLEKVAVIAQIKEVVGMYGITTEELVEALGGLKSKRAGIKADPKYRDPTTGVTWSGRGKTPTWLVGKKLDDFEIKP